MLQLHTCLARGASLYLVFIIYYCCVSVAASTCPITINGNVCPVGVAENAPPLSLPTACSGRGTCYRGACSCSAGWADVDCSRQLRRLKMGAIVLTQASLDDGPTRYLDIVTESFEKFKQSNLELPPSSQTDCLNYILKTPLIPNWDIALDLDYSSVRINIIEGGVQVLAQLSVNVPTIPVDAYVSLTPGSGTCCTPGNVSLYQETPTCTLACQSTAPRNDKARVQFTMKVSAKIFPSLNATTGEITTSVPPQDVTVELAPADLGFQLQCGLSSYPQLLFNLYNNYVQPWGVLLNEQVADAIRTTASQQAAAFSLSTGASSNVTDSTSVQIMVTAMQIQAGSHIILEIEGYVKKSRFYRAAHGLCTNIQTTYIDRALGDRDIKVPMTYDSFVESAGTDVLQTLVEIRISRSTLGAIMWAALLDETELVASLTGYSRGYGVLDAKFVGEIEWALPKFSFPALLFTVNETIIAQNLIRFAVEGGESHLICNNTGVNQLGTKFAKATFDLKPIIYGNFTDRRNTNAEFMLTGQVVDWDLSSINMNLTNPQKLSIPNALVKILASEFMQSKLPIANDLLFNEAIPVPGGLKRFVPGPRIEARHDFDNEGTDQENGYIVISTRCKYTATGNAATTFYQVRAQRFGFEIVPGCVRPLPPSLAGRRLIVQDEVTYVEPTITSSAQRINDRSLFRGRKLETASVALKALEPFARNGLCGPVPPQNPTKSSYAALTQMSFALLTCAVEKGFVRSAAKLQCMRESKVLLNGTTRAPTSAPVAVAGLLSLGLCDRQSQLYVSYSQCQAPLRVLIPALFEPHECIEGPGFSCRQTLAEVYAANCICTVSNNLEALSKCEENFVPIVIVSTGAGTPIIIYFLFWIWIRCCANEDFRTALFFRVKRRARDSWLINLAVFSSLVFLFATIGWVNQDPFREFARTISQSDLFKVSSQIESDFESFMFTWSMCFLFVMALGSMQLLILSMYSFYTGRCVWLSPLPRYLARGQWFVPSPYLAALWRKTKFFTSNLLRLQVLGAISFLAVPPLFFPFRFSVKLAQPQFGDGFVETLDLPSNFTSFGTSVEYMDTLVNVIGFSVMSSAIGFISNGVIFAFHGAAPACFTAGQIMVYLMYRKEERDRKEYASHSLPPPDTSELDRWRRIVFLFIWCAHITGALGSSIAAILLYQVLRASNFWAIFWVACWVGPVPIIFLSSSQRFRKYLFWFVFGYIAIFVIFTMSMIFITPANVGFVPWLAILLLLTVFVLVLLLLVSEFLNITDRIETSQKLHKKLEELRMKQRREEAADAALRPGYLQATTSYGFGSDLPSIIATPGSTSSPRLGTTGLRRKEQNMRSSLVANENIVSSTATGNPLFEHEKQRALHVVAAPSGVNVMNREEPRNAEFEMMKAMAAPSPQARLRLQQGSNPTTMALAQDQLQERVNMKLSSVVRPSASSFQPHPSRPFPPQQPGISPISVSGPAKAMRGGILPDMDEQEIIAMMFQQQQEQQGPITMKTSTLLSLTPAQFRERERMRKRVAGRLATRGVTDDAAQELTDRIVNYQIMKMAAEEMRTKEEKKHRIERISMRVPALRDMKSSNNTTGSQSAFGTGLANQPLAKSPNMSPPQQRSYPVVAAGTTSPVPFDYNRQQTSNWNSPPGSDQQQPRSPLQMAASPTMRSPPPPPAAGTVKKPLSPASPSQQPLETQYLRQPINLTLNEVPTRGAAPMQARSVTANPIIDDAYAAQFDPNASFKRVVYYENVDYSFRGFVKEVSSQAKAFIKATWAGHHGGSRKSADQASSSANEASSTAAYANDKTVVPADIASSNKGSRGIFMRSGRSDSSMDIPGSPSSPNISKLRSPRGQGDQAATTKFVIIKSRPKTDARHHHYNSQFIATEKNKDRLAYNSNRFRSRIARVFSERVRPLFASFMDILREKKEMDDPRTYGLRVPGRRVLFIQGLVLMFVLLVYVGTTRITVSALKDQAIGVALAASPIEVPDAAYNWPIIQNLTEVLDLPLSVYVLRATDTYILLWVIFFVWVASFMAEILYASFGRDMEEKRKGIRLARYIGFINLPLLLIATVLPCGSDYVGLAIGGIKNVVPECAPRLTSVIVGVTSNLFGVFAGTYLAFQILFVLLLIAPSISRALFFVLAREIIDLQKLSMFEPRKDYQTTRNRLQNARFVWRIFPFMSPVLTYVPLLLLCQLIGKMYASALIFLFYWTPIVLAQFQLKPKPEQQSVKEWLFFSTIWIMWYTGFVALIGMVEATARGQIAFFLQYTFESWTWYVKLMAEVCLAIVAASDVLYQFMASDDELEADAFINEYLDVLQVEAERMVLDPSQAQATQGSAGAVISNIRV